MLLAELFVQAMLVGVAIAAPVGPIGLLCIERTLQQGAWMGLATGLGAATADGIYATLGAMGMTVLISQLTALALPLSLAGSLFLAWMAVGMLRRSARPEVTSGGNVAASLVRAYASTLALTLGNPMTILSFVAVFSSLSGHARPGAAEAWVMVLGVVAGSALWWCVLAFGLGSVLRRVGPRGRQWLDRGCGLLLLGMAGWMLWQAWPR